MAKPDDVLEVRVKNHKDCAGDASDGTFRFLALLAIFTALVLILVELRVMSSMYAHVHGDETQAVGQAVRDKFLDHFETEE